MGRGDGLEEEQMTLSGQTDQLVGLGHSGYEGLFAEDILPGQKRRLGLPVMEAVGGGDVDEVDVRIGQHGIEVGVDLRDAERPGQRLAGGLLPGADRRAVECGNFRKLRRHRAGDGACAEDAEVHMGAPPSIAIFKNSAYQNSIFAICSLRMLPVH